MQKYLVIALDPKLRERPDMIAALAEAIQAAIDDVWPDAQILPDADVAVLKASDPHARYAMTLYCSVAKSRHCMDVADWAQQRMSTWTGPTHEPD